MNTCQCTNIIWKFCVLQIRFIYFFGCKDLSHFLSMFYCFSTNQISAFLLFLSRNSSIVFWCFKLLKTIDAYACLLLLQSYIGALYCQITDWSSSVANLSIVYLFYIPGSLILIPFFLFRLSPFPSLNHFRWMNLKTLKATTVIQVVYRHNGPQFLIFDPFSSRSIYTYTYVHLHNSSYQYWLNSNLIWTVCSSSTYLTIRKYYENMQDHKNC